MITNKRQNVFNKLDAPTIFQLKIMSNNRLKMAQIPIRGKNVFYCWGCHTDIETQGFRMPLRVCPECWPMTN